MNVNYFHAEPGFIFFLQNTADSDHPALYLIRIHTVFISACKYMQLKTDKKLGESQCIVYKIIQSIISKETHHTFMHAHTPTHNLWFWPKRPPLAFSLAATSVAEMSYAEMSMAEMSYIQYGTVTSVFLSLQLQVIN